MLEEQPEFDESENRIREEEEDIKNQLLIFKFTINNTDKRQNAKEGWKKEDATYQIISVGGATQI